MRYPKIFFLALVLIFSAFHTSAFCDLKEDVYARYESVMSYIEKQNFQSEAAAEITSRMTLVHQSLAGGHYSAAASQLDQLQRLIENRPGFIDLNKEAKLQWLELYFDLFQKLAVLAFLAFFLTQPPKWRSALKTGVIRGPIRFIWVFLGLFLSAVFRLFDLARYGDSVWAVFDIQIVFAVILGMIGGMGWGVLGGVLTAVFRWFLRPEMLSAPALIILAAILGACACRNMKNFIHPGRQGFLCGLVAGLLHGCLVYFPLAASLEPFDLALSIGLVAFFEALGVAVFFGMIAWVLQRDIKKEMENELLKTQLLFLQAQLNPHFLFNALNTIAAICSKTGASLAESLVIKLSDFLRHILIRKEDRVALREEIAFIEAYLSLEQARFGDTLKIEKDYQISEAAWDIKIPLLILQPLVENAMKHGLRTKTGGGKLRISVAEKERDIEVEISDDGAGRDTLFFTNLLEGKEGSQADGTGIGLANIQKRLQHIYGKENGLIFKSAPGKGTRVQVRFPNSKKGIQK